MGRKVMGDKRKALLVRLERMIGSECYNGNIQNFGPGGEFEYEGRDFRYPITMLDKDNNKVKIRGVISSEMNDKMILRGYYAFGANQLHVMRALDNILEMLEVEFGLDVEGK